MMFVTADDSASAKKKTRGVTGLVSNGAEEWLKGVVTLVEAEIRLMKVRVGRQQIISTAHFHQLRALFVGRARR